MSKINYKGIKWEDIPAHKKTEFKAAFYASRRLLAKLEWKILQMAEIYKALEEKEVGIPFEDSEK